MALIINGKTYEAGELIAYVQKLEKENKELRNRNAELKGMYAHSAREAETYKQFLELKEKEQRELIDKVKELEEKLANADYQLEGRDLEIKELKAQIEKMKCCGNCKFGYKCSLFSTQIHKENGVEYQTQAKWNKEKEKYCNVGYSGKYECWEIKEKCITLD